MSTDYRPPQVRAARAAKLAAAGEHAFKALPQYTALAVWHALQDCDRPHPGYRLWLADEVLALPVSGSDEEGDR